MIAALILSLLAGPAAATLDEGLRLMKEERYELAIVELEREAKGHPDSAEVLTNLGWAYRHVGRLDEADRCWTALVKREPKNGAYVGLLAALELDRKNPRRAEELARKALKLSPADGETTLVLARALLGQGRQADALTALEGLIRTKPGDPAVRFGMADLLVQFNRPRDSLAYLDELVKAEPDNAPFRKRRAQVLYDLGRVDESVQEWERLAVRKPPDTDVMQRLAWIYVQKGRFEDAAHLAALLDQLDPGNAGFVRLSAEIALARKRWPEAEALARRALKADSRDKQSVLLLAKSLAGQSRQKEAMELLEGLLRSEPDNPGARYEKVDVLFQLGRTEESLAAIAELVRADPSNVSYRKRHAQILYDTGRVADAEAEWRYLADQKPPDPQALLNLGWIYLKGDRAEEAFKTGSTLLSLDPANPAYLRFMVSAEIAKQDYPQAVKLARAAVGAAPEDLDTAVLLARALIENRQEDEGMALLQNLVRDHRENTGVWLQLGSLLMHKGRPEEALPFFDKLVQAEPANVKWRRTRADVLYQTGDYGQALSEFRALARATPPDAVSMHRLVDDAFFRGAWKEMLALMKELEAVEPLSLASWVRVENADVELKDIKGALAAADKVTALNPASLTGEFMKAELLADQGDFPGAKASYERCLARNPHSRRALDGLARVAGDSGHYAEAIRREEDIQKTYPSEKAYPYLDIKIAQYLAESGKVDQGMELFQKLSRTRPVAIPILLYHGVVPIDRSDAISIKNFRAHMKAIKKAGYHPITVSELAPFYTKGKPLPKKPILITFDDGRADTFRNADPILAEMGFKATMFVIGAALTRYPYHASAQAIRHYRANGRWELQAHSDKSHEPQPVDAEGHSLQVLANRKWLPDQGRIETPEEFRARIEADYLSIKRLLESNSLQENVIGFAFPLGEFGQIDATNVPDAALINRSLVQKHFLFSFIQDLHGFNTKDSLRSELVRYEPPKDMTAKELIAHLTMDEPWVQAKLGEARLWVWMGQPARSLEVVRELERDGVEGPDIVAQKGIALDRLGQPYEAQKLYAMALEMGPNAEQTSRYQDLSRQAEFDNGPHLDTQYSGFSDNASRSYSKALLRLGAPVRRFQLSGTFARGSYYDKGVPRFDGTQAGLELRSSPTPELSVGAAYSRRQYTGQGVRQFDAYEAQAGWLVVPQVKLGAHVSGAEVENAAAILQGVRQYRQGAHAEWYASLDTTLAVDGDTEQYSDGNKEGDFRFEITRRLTEWFSAGYDFWYGDSSRQQTAYWTPNQLRQHMVVADFTKMEGPIRARLQLRAGYGYEGLVSRPVQAVMGGLEWRSSDYLSVFVNGVYSNSPVYISRELTAGLGLRF